MRLTLITGGGTGRAPSEHYETLIGTAQLIERCVASGRILAGRMAARGLTAIERGVVTTRMLRDGFGPDEVLRVLA